jgi:hypothetical protein
MEWNEQLKNDPAKYGLVKSNAVAQLCASLTDMFKGVKKQFAAMSVRGCDVPSVFADGARVTLYRRYIDAYLTASDEIAAAAKKSPALRALLDKSVQLPDFISNKSSAAALRALQVRFNHVCSFVPYFVPSFPNHNLCCSFVPSLFLLCSFVTKS